MELTHRVALVTGAGSGIGRATALKLAAEGANVALLGLKRQSLEEVANQVEAAQDRTLVLPADVTDSEAIQGAVDHALKKWNRWEMVVANAGINGVWAPIDELAPDEWRRTHDVNLTGSFVTIKYAVPAIRQQGGSVVVMASVNGTRVFSNAGATANASSKAAHDGVAQFRGQHRRSLRHGRLRKHADLQRRRHRRRLVGRRRQPNRQPHL